MRDIYRKNSRKLSIDHNEQTEIQDDIVRYNGYDFLVVGIYVVIAIILTWPLIANIGSLIPGMNGDSGDSWHFVWNIWWIKQVIVNHQDLFFTEYLYYPNGVSLVYHTLTIVSGLVLFVLIKYLSIVSAFDVLYLLYILLAAVFSYELAKNLWGSRKGAFLAGIVYAFSPYFFAHSLGHFNLTVLWPFPLLGWLLLKMSKKISWTNGVWLGLVLAVMFLTDWQYFVMALVFVLVYLVVRGLNFWKNSSGWWWSQFALSGAVCLLLVYPVLSKSLLAAQNYLPQALISEISYWSADLMGYLIPSFQNPFWGDLGQKYYSLYNFSGVESVVYAGWVVLGLVIGSLLLADRKYGWQKVWWWSVLLVFFVLSLGPFLKIAGVTDFQISDVHFTIPLPYLLFYKIPFLSVARVPARFFVVVSLALAVLSAYSFTQVEQRMKKWMNGYSKLTVFMLMMVLSGLILIEYSCWPMSFQNTQIPKVYSEIKKDSGDFVIMELPLWWTSGHRSLGKVETKIQYYQTYHEKKILNGSVSRVPNALFDYYLQVPGIKYLIDVSKNTADENDLDKNLVLKKFRDDLDVRYIVVHKSYFDIGDFYKIREYLESNLGLVVWYEDEGEIAYKLW